MEIRGVPIKKELIEKYKNDPCISKLYFYLLRNDSKEAESYFKSIIKVLNTLNIPYEEEITFSFNDAKEKITKANLNKKITSIVVSRPIFYNEQELFDLIDLKKDVDMLSTLAAGRLMRGDIRFLPATAGSVKNIIENLNINLTGKKALVIGRSPSVGSPIFWYLQKSNATVTLAHSKTKIKDLKKAAKDSDLVILAAGVQLLKPEDIKDNAIIIDCGYNQDGQGDLSFIPENASYTPVPGGVGPVTTITLITNSLNLYHLFY